jgi:hypothetical protein
MLSDFANKMPPSPKKVARHVAISGQTAQKVDKIAKRQFWRHTNCVFYWFKTTTGLAADCF